MSKPSHRLLWLAAFLALASAAKTQTPNLDQILDMRVAQYSVQANGLADTLIAVSKRFKVPIGVEWVRDANTSRFVARSWTGETVRGILASTVDMWPDYSLRISDGVVDVSNRDLFDSSENFLNLQVPGSFQTHREVGGLTNQRLQSAIQDTVSTRQTPPRAGHGGSYATGLQETPITLALQGLTVRAALDKLVEASDYKIWVVTFSPSRTLTATGYRRTETLWHPAPFSDSSQPMWDVLAWRQYGPAEQADSGPVR